MADTIKVVVVGCGNMGSSHARAYVSLEGFELVGLVAPTPQRRGPLAKELGGIEQFDTLDDALESTHPQAVSICSYPDTHALYAMGALEQGLHLFIEKPLALTVEQAGEIVALAKEKSQKSSSAISSGTARPGLNLSISPVPSANPSSCG